MLTLVTILRRNLGPGSLLISAFCALAHHTAGAAESSALAQGSYFGKKSYQPKPLLKFTEAREQLPSPIYGERPEWVSMYWKAWELAFNNFHEPIPGSGYVSQFIDAAFNQNIFLWDTCFMTNGVEHDYL
jgi:hypothetical protein